MQLDRLIPQNCFRWYVHDDQPGVYSFVWLYHLPLQWDDLGC